jgi:hypothetical protein
MTFCAQLLCVGPFNSPDAKMNILHMSLHGALMLEVPPTLKRTEGCPGGGTFYAQLPKGGHYCSPDAQMYVLHMSLHGALMLEGTPALMWTMQENVLVRDLLCSATMGRALLLT